MENTTGGSVLEQPTHEPILSAKLPGSIALLKLSIAYYREHFHALALVMVVPLVMQILSILISNPAVSGILMFATVVASVLATISLFGIIVGGWSTEGSVGEIYKKSTKWFWPMVLVQAYVTITVIGGLFLFVVPGIYAAIALNFAVYVFFAENKTGVSAIVESWYYVKDNWGPVLWRISVFWIIFAIIGAALAAADVGPSLIQILEQVQKPESAAPEFSSSPVISVVQAVIQFLLASPLTVIYASLLFRSLKAIKTATPTESDKQKIEKRVRMFMMVGIVGLVLVILVSGAFVISLLKGMNSFGGIGLPSAVIDALQKIPGLH